jgi:hypothetical protein
MEKVILFTAEWSFKAGVLVGFTFGVAIAIGSIGIALFLK